MPSDYRPFAFKPLYLFIALSLSLAGCGKSDPIILPAAHQDMYGVWEKTETRDNGLIIDNVLLVMHADNTVTYVSCFKKPGYRTSQSLPGLSLIRFEGNKFDAQIGWGIFTWTEHFTVARFPYREHDQTYLEVNGVRLRKLLPHETSDYANWPCNDDKRKEDKRI